MHESETTFEAQETELFTITLKATPDERLIVRSAEVICVGSRVRFTFAADSEPEKVFAPDAARAVRKLTERVVSQRGMLILQDFAVNLASIVLSDCRAVAADISDGGCQIMLRFKRFVGDLLSFFSSDYEPKLRLGSVTCLSQPSTITTKDPVKGQLVHEAFIGNGHVDRWACNEREDVQNAARVVS